MPHKFREVSSPLSNFNNIMVELSDSLNKIIYGEKIKLNQLTLKSDLVFEQSAITVMKLFKLYTPKNSQTMSIQILRPCRKEELEILASISKHYLEVAKVYYRYIQMYNLIGQGYDDVPMELLKSIVYNLENSIFKDNENFLLPFKNKVERNLSMDGNVGYMFKQYSKFELIIKFQNESKLAFNYTIIKVLSSDLNENKSLENLRYLEKDILLTGIVQKRDAEKFIIDLFHYGNLPT